MGVKITYQLLEVNRNEGASGRSGLEEVRTAVHPGIQLASNRFNFDYHHFRGSSEVNERSEADEFE